VLVSAFLPCVTVAGTPLDLNVGLLSVDIVPGGRTVSGTGTTLWPIVCGVGLLVLVLSLVPRAGRLLVLLGALITLAGAGLIYYVENIVKFKTDQHGPIVALLARATITSTTGPGPPLLLASGVAVLLGGLVSAGLAGRPR